jgi:type II secretory pathway pseudopilin PulG
MEDQPNYQPNEPSQQTAPVAVKPEKSSKKAAVVTIILVIITALGAAGATWYYMDGQQKDQQANNQKQVERLKSEVSSLTIQTAKIKTAPTTPTTDQSTSNYTTTKNDPAAAPNIEAIPYINTINQFCHKDLDAFSKLTKLVYISDKNGKYANCTFTDKDDGHEWAMLAYISNNNWVKMWSGGDEMQTTFCSKYKIPNGIYTGCTGTY